MDSKKKAESDYHGGRIGLHSFSERLPRVGIAKDLLTGERLESNLDICLVVIVVVVVVSIMVLYR